MRDEKLGECGGPETKRRIFHEEGNSQLYWIQLWDRITWGPVVSTDFDNTSVFIDTERAVDMLCKWTQSGLRGDCKGEMGWLFRQLVQEINRTEK